MTRGRSGHGLRGALAGLWPREERGSHGELYPRVSEALAPAPSPPRHIRPLCAKKFVRRKMTNLLKGLSFEPSPVKRLCEHLVILMLPVRKLNLRKVQ